MINKDILIINPMGLHSRPCAVLAKKAKKYDCQIRLSYQDKSADGRSMLGLMKLGVVNGSMITLHCEGTQEQEASAALGEFLATLVEAE